MSTTLWALIPLAVAVCVSLLAFAGCSGFSSESGPVVKDPPVTDPPVTDPPGTDPGVPPDTRPSYGVAISAPGGGLAVHWPMTEPFGSKTITSDDPNHLVGTCTDNDADCAQEGALQGRDPKDSGVRFGPSGRIAVPHAGILNPAEKVAFSVELWIKFPLDSKDWQMTNEQSLVSSIEIIGPDTFGYDLSLTYVKGTSTAGPVKIPTITGRVYSGVGNTATEVEMAITPSGDFVKWNANWNYVIFVYDATAISLIARNASDTSVWSAMSTPNPVYKPNASWDFVLGAAHVTETTYKRWYRGLLDEVAFYNRALTLGEASNHFGIALPVVVT